MLVALLGVGLVPALATAYSWQFGNSPVQCGELDLKITGSGKPPYRALFLPAQDAPSQPELRHVIDVPFNDSSSLKIPAFSYPSNSKFVVVVSDSDGFGTGGASKIVVLGSGDDSSCLLKKLPDLGFTLRNTPDSPSQCTDDRLWWDPATVKGNVQYQVIIPSGNAFNVTPGQNGNGNVDDKSVNSLGTGFNWHVNIQAGTQLLLTALDDRGYVAGVTTTSVQYGNNADTSCLNNNSPSTTSGDPAGGSFPTSGSSPSPNSSSDGGSSGGSKSNIGPIVGGVVGGVVALVALLLLGLFCYRRRKFHRSQKERPVDLINDGDDVRDDNLPQYYRPDPFVLPDPSVTDGHSMREGEGAGLLAAGSGGRPSHESQGTHSTHPPVMPAALSIGSRRPSSDRRSSTGFGGSTTTGRKGGAPTPLRPVNFIVHDDGGRVPDADKGLDDAEETIELPPAYTNIKRGPSTRIPNEGEGESSAAGSSAAATTAAPPAVTGTA